MIDPRPRLCYNQKNSIYERDEGDKYRLIAAQRVAEAEKETGERREIHSGAGRERAHSAAQAGHAPKRTRKPPLPGNGEAERRAVERDRRRPANIGGTTSSALVLWARALFC